MNQLKFKGIFLYFKKIFRNFLCNFIRILPFNSWTVKIMKNTGICFRLRHLWRIECILWQFLLQKNIWGMRLFTSGTVFIKLSWRKSEVQLISNMMLWKLELRCKILTSILLVVWKLFAFYCFYNFAISFWFQKQSLLFNHFPI